MYIWYEHIAARVIALDIVLQSIKPFELFLNLSMILGIIFYVYWQHSNYEAQH